MTSYYVQYFIALLLSFVEKYVSSAAKYPLPPKVAD